MPDRPTRPASGGGFLIAAGVLGGAIVGFLFHQPTIGLLIGTVVTVSIAALLWLRERRG